MRGGALPPAILCAAFGLALAFGPRKSFAPALAVLAVVALAASFLTFPPASQDAIFLGCWISVVVAALCVHLPRGVGPRLALVLAVDCGFWTGAVVAAAGVRLDLLKSLPLALVCLPGFWLVASKRGVVLKVATSWLIAISILSASLPLVPTPGYKPDHMD